jgi:2-methylcitrate dehydratase
MKAHVKVYPCVASGQAAVAAALDMHRAYGDDPDRFKRITVMMADHPTVNDHQRDPGRANPCSREAADHSFPFLVAVSLMDGFFGLAQFEGERWHDQKVRSLMSRIVLTMDADLARRAPNAYPCSIIAEDKDGHQHRTEVLFPPGYSRAGLDEATVIEKFRALAAPRLDSSKCQRVIEAAMSLDRSASCTDLMDAMG